MSMRDETITRLFDSTSIHFEIPKYQRAYSWEKEQWRQFLQDLKDAESGYYLGHFLFESDKSRLWVIDGQQRLTTCVIFVRAAIDVLSARADGDFAREIRILRRRFLIDDDLGPRLKAVHFDNPVFQDCIVSGEAEPGTFITKSSKNIVDAKKYFIDEMQQVGNAAKVLELVQRMEDAVITRFDVEDKAMAARIFAFQNDRGKELTQLESIKAFLMLTVYTKGESSLKGITVELIDEQFARIYETIMRSELDEDQVLTHYWRARNGYGVGRVAEEVKKQLSLAINPTEWVRTFVRELADAFSFVAEFSIDSGEYSVRLRLLNNMALSYPVLIRARLKGVKADSVAYGKLLRLMENLTFRSLIRGGRADIQSRLTNHLRRIDDEISLHNEIGQIVTMVKNGWWDGYWSDDELVRKLNEGFYGNRVDNYLLWQYERSLHGNGYKAPVAVTAQEMMKNESVEHIAPQTPKDRNPIANGYGEYDDRDNPENGIESGGWMNRLGNLVLASQSQNSSLGNKPFAAKLDDYSRVILAQQTEIRNYAKMNEKGDALWTVDSIRDRQRRIVGWARDNWDISKVLA